MAKKVNVTVKAKPKTKIVAPIMYGGGVPYPTVVKVQFKPKVDEIKK